MIFDWFGTNGWQPFDFQKQVWAAYTAGESGLIHAPTGTGKTYAAWLGPLLEWTAAHPDPAAWESLTPPKLKVIWLTPLRALATDTEQSLKAPLEALSIPWTVERRTGDTSSYAKQRQLKKPPSALITTPESLSLLLSQANARQLFGELELVVVDEWHELLGNKRGTQTELCLARLRRWRPELRTWGLSATLGNLDVALTALLGTGGNGRLIRGQQSKEVVIDALMPASIERFPWAGHMGLRMLSQVVEAIEEHNSTLVFTNTRNQAEKWYQALLERRPDWAGLIALHHGSISAEARRWVEDGLREGYLKAVVCTSSLDLGVDFHPVDRVLQIGSPKGVGRLLQRAGRSGHQPGLRSRVSCVPTHAWELIEVAAVREALDHNLIEGREPPPKPLDVLVQHLVTVGLGGGFEPEALLAEIRTTYSFATLSDEEWTWALDFVVKGGEALETYPEYRRVVEDVEAGVFRVADRKIASRHRMSIGTIVGDPNIRVKYLKGPTLGSINESFISRLKPGDKFIFAGRPLEFVRVREMTAWVKRAKTRRGAIPRWTGTSLPISPVLGDMLRRKLADAADGVFDDPELWLVKPLLALQAAKSHLPDFDELLVERLKTREGYHLFVYPFAGKLVHQGLSALLAYRLARERPLTFTLTSNDYGFELLSAEPSPLHSGGLVEIDGLFRTDNLLADIQASLNASEMAKRQFREVARVAGLVFQGPPGRSRSARHLQASSSLFYDVFSKYDQDNLLLQQAQREVLTRQLEESRLTATLRRIQGETIRLIDIERPSPLSFPIFVDRMSALLTTEKLADRVAKLVAQLEKWGGEEK